VATGTTYQIPTETRMLYTRVLASWASDSLNLRREGLNRPSQREGSGLGIAPSANPSTLTTPTPPTPPMGQIRRAA